LPATVLNVDLSTITAATDVAFGFGDPIQEIADLNFQSGPDSDVVARLQLYGAAYRLRYGVPVRSLLILLRPAADHAGLDGTLAYTAGQTRLQFQCEVVRMWQQPVTPFLRGGVGLLPLAPLCQTPAGVPLDDALRQVIHEIDQRLLADVPHAEAVRLMTAAFILTGLRVPRHRMDELFRGVQIMHDSSAFELMEWRAEIRRSHRLLLSLGRRRFGPPSAEAEAAVTAIQDLDRLERMVEAALTAGNWQELLEIG
jgi:hypothetical protein